MQTINYDQLTDNPYQSLARPGGLDHDHVRTLARNIRANYDAQPDTLGLRELPRVRPDGDRYQIADGHHRIAALQLLREGDSSDDFPGDERFAPIPVLVEQTEDQAMLTGTMDTDLKKNLSPIGWANGFKGLVDAGWSQGEIAERYGVSQPYVSQHLALLELPETLQALIDAGALSARHGRELLPLARHLPDVLAEGIDKDGVGVWRESWGEGRLFSVALLANEVERTIKRHTIDLGLAYHTPWHTETWVPPVDLLPGQYEKLLSNLPDGPCATCEHAVVFKRGESPRCTMTRCHHARRQAWDYFENQRLEEERNRLIDRVREQITKPKPATATAPAPQVQQSAQPDGPRETQTAPATVIAPHLRRDFYDERLQAHKELIRKLRQVFTAEFALFDPADAARAVPLLQFLDNAVNRPKGWGDPTDETDPAALWGSIIGGALKRLSGGSSPRYDQYKQVEAVIEALGGEIAPEAYEPLAQLDAEQLTALSYKLASPTAASGSLNVIEQMERLLETALLALTGEQAASILTNLELAGTVCELPAGVTARAEALRDRIAEAVPAEVAAEVAA